MSASEIPMADALGVLASDHPGSLYRWRSFGTIRIHHGPWTYSEQKARDGAMRYVQRKGLSARAVVYRFDKDSERVPPTVHEWYRSDSVTVAIFEHGTEVME